MCSLDGRLGSLDVQFPDPEQLTSPLEESTWQGHVPARCGIQVRPHIQLTQHPQQQQEQMLQLSLSWLGLGPVAASPWLLWLLVGGSWLLARVLAWTYTFYDNCHCLQCFLQSPKQNWFWGHQGLVTPMEEGIKKFVELVAIHGFKLWLGPTFPLLVLCHPDIIRSITSASGDGLLLSGGDKWSRHRRMLTLAFHFNILKPYMKIFNKSVNIMHDKWQRLASESSARLDMFEHISLMTLDRLQKCVFSFESNCQEKPSEYIAAILKLSAFIEKSNQHVLLYLDFLYYLTPDGQRFRRACRLVHDFTDAVIQERRRTLPTQGIDDFLKNKAKSKTLDFIDVLLLSKPCGLSRILYHLAKHPEYQERCRQEVRELLKDRETIEIECDLGTG
ncbi:hypothetical protein H8958_002459 [Nasalis larvatus]